MVPEKVAPVDAERTDERLASSMEKYVSLAVELGAHNICINAVAPGFTDTEASRSLADVDRYDTSRTPLRRVGTPEDITGAALFLASPESDFITGQTLLVDGGRHMH